MWKYPVIRAGQTLSQAQEEEKKRREREAQLRIFRAGEDTSEFLSQARESSRKAVEERKAKEFEDFKRKVDRGHQFMRQSFRTAMQTKREILEMEKQRQNVYSGYSQAYSQPEKSLARNYPQMVAQGKGMPVGMSEIDTRKRIDEQSLGEKVGTLGNMTSNYMLNAIIHLPDVVYRNLAYSNFIKHAVNVNPVAKLISRGINASLSQEDKEKGLRNKITQELEEYFKDNKWVHGYGWWKQHMRETLEAEGFRPSEGYEELSLVQRFAPKHLEETLWNFAGGVVPSMASFAIPIPGFGATAMYVNTSTEIYNDAVDYGVDKSLATDLASTAGVVMALLEKIVPGDVFSKGAKKKFLSSFVKNIMDYGKTAAIEGVTEVSQEAVQMLAESTYKEVTKEEIPDRLVTSFIGGLVGGAGFGLIDLSFKTANTITLDSKYDQRSSKQKDTGIDGGAPPPPPGSSSPQQIAQQSSNITTEQKQQQTIIIPPDDDGASGATGAVQQQQVTQPTQQPQNQTNVITPQETIPTEQRAEIKPVKQETKVETGKSKQQAEQVTKTKQEVKLDSKQSLGEKEIESLNRFVKNKLESLIQVVPQTVYKKGDEGWGDYLSSSFFTNIDKKTVKKDFKNIEFKNIKPYSTNKNRSGELADVYFKGEKIFDGKYIKEGVYRISSEQKQYLITDIANKIAEDYLFGSQLVKPAETSSTESKDQISDKEQGVSVKQKQKEKPKDVLPKKVIVGKAQTQTKQATKTKQEAKVETEQEVDPYAKPTFMRNKKTGKFGKGVTTAEKRAVESYTSTGYSVINKALRNGKEKSLLLDDRNAIKSLDKVIEKYVLEKKTTVYRSGGKTEVQLLANVKPDDIVEMPAFTSTSFSLDFVKKFSTMNKGNLIYEIDIPAGKGLGVDINQIIKYMENEQEFLLKRGSQIIIKEVGTINVGGKSIPYVKGELNVKSEDGQTKKGELPQGLRKEADRGNRNEDSGSSKQKGDGAKETKPEVKKEKKSTDLGKQSEKVYSKNFEKLKNVDSGLYGVEGVEYDKTTLNKMKEEAIAFVKNPKNKEAVARIANGLDEGITGVSPAAVRAVLIADYGAKGDIEMQTTVGRTQSLKLTQLGQEINVGKMTASETHYFSLQDVLNDISSQKKDAFAKQWSLSKDEKARNEFIKKQVKNESKSLAEKAKMEVKKAKQEVLVELNSLLDSIKCKE